MSSVWMHYPAKPRITSFRCRLIFSFLCPFTAGGFISMTYDKNMLSINNAWAFSAKTTYIYISQNMYFFFFHSRPLESFAVRFLLSSFHPLLLLSRAPSSSPLHSCCVVSSDRVCQVLSSCSTSLVFYSLAPSGGRDGRLDWLWQPLKWMPGSKPSAQTDYNALHGDTQRPV